MLKSKFKKARRAKAYSQEYMADRLHMDTASYNRRENGKCEISESEWQKLAEILEVPMEDILEDPPHQTIIIENQGVGNINSYNIENHVYAIPKELLENQFNTFVL